MRHWKISSPAGIAFRKHLYTRIVSGKETDEIERWLEREYETPVHDVLLKIASDDRLTPNDWEKLIRFIAAQDVRTPAHLSEAMKRWNETEPNLVQQTLDKIALKLADVNYNGQRNNLSKIKTEELPINVSVKFESEQQSGQIEVSMLTGRRLWLWEMKRSLQNTSKILHGHKWTIVKPPKGMTWFTSDNPVIRLNFHNESKYDFCGGWGSSGTEIILPLDPHHLLYTQIGKRQPFHRYERMPVNQARLIRQMIAEHAHRLIISQECDEEIPSLRPRIVDADLYQWEHNRWEQWHKEQTEAEQEFDNEKAALRADKTKNE